MFMKNGLVTMEIEDQGKGLPASLRNLSDGEPSTVGVGLRGMNERIRQLGGKLEMYSGQKGTVVRARVPVKRATEQSMAS
jgi:signal transduction histidine kinase